MPASSVRTSSPDLAEVAREAVISFLRDASAAEAGPPAVAATVPSQPEGDGAADAAVQAQPAEPAEPAPAAAGLPEAGTAAGLAAALGGDLGPADVAVRAAATGVATLDRIEAAAARLEADIDAALSEQEKLRAGAGAAAERAVRAALESSASAGTAQEASRRASASARLVGKWVVVVLALVVLQLLFVLLFAASTR